MASRFVRFFRSSPLLSRSVAVFSASVGSGYLLYHLTIDKRIPIRMHAAQKVDSNRSSRFNFIAEVAELASPGVVLLETYKQRFGRTFRLGSGSGFLISPEGSMLTNAHVVSQSNQIRVRLQDGSTYDATIEAIDPVIDLALLKITSKSRGGKMFNYVQLGSSSDLRVGEWVVAIGSPMSLANTVTAGIVSTVGRASEELGLTVNMEYVQTDAAITVGNSGGPLVNLDGKVIGINTITSVPGFSFAIPIDRAKEFIICKQEGRQRRYFGVSVLSLNRSLTNELRLRIRDFPDVISGVLISQITEGSPAHRAGLNAGDIILEVNSKKITKGHEFVKFIQTSNSFCLKIQRGSTVFLIDVTIEAVL
eukprot:m.1106 g.1106  ORF g.1106 m.1106 type:complete len:364 (+) comp5702_c0_seq2:23-1114(+)